MQGTHPRSLHKFYKWRLNIKSVAIFSLLVISSGFLCALYPPLSQKALEADLATWFRLRQFKPSPEDVVIVNLDSESGARLGLPPSPEKWPRTIYAKLVERLADLGALSIVLDVHFSDVKNLEEDLVFAKAIKQAASVVLFEYTNRRLIKLDAVRENGLPKIAIETAIPPLPVLASAAVATAPFPLPKVPVRLNRFWTFKSSLGDVPSLPVVALYLYVFNKEKRLKDKLSELFPDLFQEFEDMRNVKLLALRLRQYLLLNKGAAERAFNELDHDVALKMEEKRLLKVLIYTAAGPESPFLNFYGPPGTILTIPCSTVLAEESSEELLINNIKGRVVFVGAATKNPSEQKDGFYTVYTRPDGLDLSGVEIAATAFANLLNQESVRPATAWMRALIIVAWGLFVTMVAFFLPPVFSALTFTMGAATYVYGGLVAFTTKTICLPFWLPVIFPCVPAYGFMVLWQYSRVRTERKNISKAFSHYLPSKVVDTLARDRTFINRPPQLLYGVCLMTDAEQYTSLSEHMEPGELARFMNQYYEHIFEPVKKNGGVISDVLGDSMLAIWTGAEPNVRLNASAIKAALEIMEKVRDFNKKNNQSIQLPTRIGLHSGHLALGHLGTPDHFEFTPIGDIVNTASRIEGLNKYLGTRILSSGDLLSLNNGFLVRELGSFLLAGKSKPIVIYEILSTIEESTPFQRQLCNSFGQALRKFRERNWDEAARGFMECGIDGPARFYLKLCNAYLKNPPLEDWTATIRLDRK